MNCPRGNPWTIAFISVFILMIAGGLMGAAMPAFDGSLIDEVGFYRGGLRFRDFMFAGVMAAFPCRDAVVSNTLSSTSEPAYAVNRDGVIVGWNPAAENAFGYAASEALGRHCWELLAIRDVFHNRYCGQGCPLREAAFRHEPLKDTTLSFRTASNDRLEFSICMLLVGDSSGQEMLVHLCHPVQGAEAHDPGTISIGRPAANQRRGALTAREIEVLALLAEGKETPEIASALCISLATARNHIQHILYKLHVHSRIAAVNLGRKLGLI